jgi:uncharacterized coiled-coil protein SlyX
MPKEPDTGQPDRRVQNPELRRTVEDLLEQLRELSGRVKDMSPEEIAEAERRLQSVTEMLWPAVLREKEPPHA